MGAVLSAGVINVITRKPGGKPELRVWGEYGQYDQGRGGLNASGRSGSLAGSVEDTSSRTKVAGTQCGQKTGGHLCRPVLPDDRSVVDLRVDYTHFNNEQAGSLDAADFESDPRQDYYTFTYAKMEKITPALTYNRTVGDAGDLSLTLQSRFVNDHETFSAYGIRFDPRRRSIPASPRNWMGSTTMPRRSTPTNSSRSVPA